MWHMVPITAKYMLASPFSDQIAPFPMTIATFYISEIHTSFSNSLIQIIVQLPGFSTDRDMSGLVMCVCVKCCNPGQCEGDVMVLCRGIHLTETSLPERSRSEPTLSLEKLTKAKWDITHNTTGCIPAAEPCLEDLERFWSWLFSIKVMGCWSEI